MGRGRTARDSEQEEVIQGRLELEDLYRMYICMDAIVDTRETLVYAEDRQAVYDLLVYLLEQPLSFFRFTC